MGVLRRRMRGLLAALLAVLAAVAHGQTIPAVYYKLYYVYRDDVANVSRIETIDANGGGMGVIAPSDGSETLSLADSIAFDGKFLYVIDRETTIKSFTPSIPTTEVTVLQMPGARITCLGIGHAEPGNKGRSILYYGVAGGSSVSTNGTSTITSFPSLRRAELNGTNDVKVAEWESGDCQYLIQQDDLILFSSTDGNVWQWNATTSGIVNATILQSASPGNCTGPITTVAGSNLLLFGANEREIRSNNLDEVVGKEPGPPVDRLWTSLTGNTTNAMISLNGALVTSSDTGITFFFPPFSTEETSQSEARIILENNPFIRGMATDSAASLAVSALLAVLVLLACVA